LGDNEGEKVPGARNRSEDNLSVVVRSENISIFFLRSRFSIVPRKNGTHTKDEERD
jgi:hypothetical protein